MKEEAWKKEHGRRNMEGRSRKEQEGVYILGQIVCE
jgi:hypothetical protein